MYPNQYQMNYRANQSHDNSVYSLMRWGEIAKLKKNQAFQNMIMSSCLSGDLSVMKDVEPFVKLKAIEEIFREFPFQQPSEEVSKHDVFNERAIIIGKVKDEKRFFTYPIDWLNQHSVITGGSGTGKTNLLYGIILQCMNKGIPVIIFDKDKTDYRHLRRLNEDLMIFNANEVPLINPLAPPSGVNPKHWLSIFIQVFAKTHDLLGASEAFLIEAVSKLYEEFGVFSGNDTCPTMIDLYEKIKSYSFRGNSRKSGYQDSIMNRLEAYVSLNPELFEYSKCVPIEWLLRHSFVYEVKGLVDRMARFMMTILLYSIFIYRIANGQRGNVLKSLVVIDECKWLAPYGFNENIGHSALSSILSMGREVGLGLILADQTAKLEDSVYVNSMLRICMRLQNGEDIMKTARTMSLSKEQADYIARLDRGECIIRIPKEDPFVIETLKVNLG